MIVQCGREKCKICGNSLDIDTLISIVFVIYGCDSNEMKLFHFQIDTKIIEANNEHGFPPILIEEECIFQRTLIWKKHRCARICYHIRLK